MPAYPGNDLATLMYENSQKFAWDAETVPQGSLSVAYQLRRERGAFYPSGISVEVTFSASPGVFEVDVMVSDTDQASHYISAGKIDAVNAGFVGRLELPTLFAKYVALQYTTAPNAATTTITGLITR